MRVLFISGEFPPDVGGVGDYTRRLAMALVARGHDVAVLTGRYGLLEFRANGESTAATSHLATETTKLETWSLRPYLTALNTFRPDLVHLQYQIGAYGMHPAVLLLPARLRRRGVPVVVTAHDLRLPYLFPKADAVRARLMGRLLGDARAVIVTNRQDAQRLAGQAPPSRELFSPRRPSGARYTVIPIGSNIEPVPQSGRARTALRAVAGVGPDGVLLVYFGLLSRTKGVLELLGALGELPSRFRLLVVGGSTPLPDDQRFRVEVEAAIARPALRKRVTITGALPAHDVSAFLLAADIAVLPFADGASYRRGSLLAALVHGLPTVTTLPAAPLDPSLLNGRDALLVPPADARALRAAIERLDGDRELRERLGDGARKLAQRFGWPAIAEQHESVYHSLL